MSNGPMVDRLGNVSEMTSKRLSKVVLCLNRHNFFLDLHRLNEACLLCDCDLGLRVMSDADVGSILGPRNRMLDE